MNHEEHPSELAQKLAQQIAVKVETREATAKWKSANKSKQTLARFGQIAAGFIVAVGSTIIAAAHWQPDDPVAWLIVALAILAVMASGVRIAMESDLLRFWVK